MSEYVMPKRQPGNGMIEIRRTNRGDGEAPEDGILIQVQERGEWREIVISEFNAWRLLGILSVLLGLPLQRAAAKAIKL